MATRIDIRGAREHNLRGFDLSLPRQQLVVVTGVSGSGKSSLAFDTIFREGQRRFLQSYSAHARHYLGRLERAEVESISGLSPALAIGMARRQSNPRSTVGTLSEVWDYLRLLFARAGEGPCPQCQEPLAAWTPGARAQRRCAACGYLGPAVESQLFSFNAAPGACPDCQGLGECDRVAPELLVADASKSLRQGALVPTTPKGYIVYSQVTMEVLDEVCQAHGFSVDQPWAELSDEQRGVVFYGSDRVKVAFGKHPLENRLKWSGITARPRELGHYKGLVPTIDEIIRRNRNKNAMRFARSRPCEACGGSGLGAESLAFTVAGQRIDTLANWSLDELAGWLGRVPDGAQAAVVTPIAEAAGARLALLGELGLSYLTLARRTPTLSGGERQRIRLASQVGGRLQGILYVLDEPSMGLHVRDNRRLLQTLTRLRDNGNTVLVVEHDAEVMRAADWLVDIGPEAGTGGGELLFSGPTAELLAPGAQGRSPGLARSHTRAYLSGEQRIETPAARRSGSGHELTVVGARGHNLKGTDVRFRLGALNLVTGVSGSGKSTLVVETLGRALAQHLHGAKQTPAPHEALRGAEQLDKLIVIDQAPIGRSPRSNPATYTKLFDRIRSLFAAQPEARERGFGKGRFSFNAKGGRCEDCQGAGVQQVGMHLLGDVGLRCETCGGRRFNDETLAIEYRGLSVADVLALPIAEAHDFFAGERLIQRQSGAMLALGLGYLTLGQPSTTLSGGEAQRIKLAAELSRPATGQTLYLLDEPTSGLADHDIRLLLTALDGLVAAGNTVVAIEHHLAVIGAADWVVDLGPGGGQQGGQVVAMGTPGEVAGARGSHTGAALTAALEQPTAASESATVVAPRPPATPLRLTGVTTHNLKDVDLCIEAGSFTVITGVSGSGKSSLALDTLFAEGQRRFTESLSPFARRFMEQMPRPAVKAVEGLSPTLAVTRRGLAPNPRSTVGTLSELDALYRLLFSRAGVVHCPEHQLPLGDDGCPQCGRLAPAQLPASRFSFNHQLGACPACRGLGSQLRADADKLVSHPERSVLLGAMDGHKSGRFYGEPDGQFTATLQAVGQAHGIDFSHPWQQLSAVGRRLAMDGSGDQSYEVDWHYRRRGREGRHQLTTTWVGFLALVDEEYARKQADHRGDAMRAILSRRVCPDCGGQRLEALARAVRFAGTNLGELRSMSVTQSQAFFAASGGLSARERSLSEQTRQAIGERLAVLQDVGLGYLGLDRPAGSLSGGEARRLQLAALVGSDLCGVTYVLDEPTIGLHAADTRPLIATLERLRDLGNTVVVVEHDLDVIRAADHVVELGPGAGEAGGEIVAQGSVDELLAGDTPTACALREDVRARVQEPSPSGRKLGPGLRIRGAWANNLSALDVAIPSGGLVAVTGVSGSGKSSLVFEVIRASVEAGAPCGCEGLEGLGQFARVTCVDPSPIGHSAASNPATYSGLFDDIRPLFARSESARERGYNKGRFSFTSKAGQCPQCKGQGALRTAMGFLADVWVPCESCRGARYNADTLAVHLEGHSIADVLALSVEQAAELFAAQRRLSNGLQRFLDVGLGYLRLGQPAPTLSGGEAQRLKLVSELIASDRRGRTTVSGPSLYLLDEPTVGLHSADVTQLLTLFGGLCDAGHTVLVVEHHLDVVRAADWVIDLGPGGGPDGGRLVAEGPPAVVAEHPESVTGRVLRAGR